MSRKSGPGKTHDPKFAIFVEGGGTDNDSLKTECRRAFSEFFTRAGLTGGMPRVYPCGGRNQAYEAFEAELRTSGRTDVNLLLVDSEEEIAQGENSWDFVQRRDNWKRPAGATDEQLHLMVRCTESWFLADVLALERHFGKGFESNRLPKTGRPIESIPKEQVLAGLSESVKDTTALRRYDKGRDSFKILATLDPGRVEAASPRAKLFLDHVRRVAEGRRTSRK